MMSRGTRAHVAILGQASSRGIQPVLAEAVLQLPSWMLSISFDQKQKAKTYEQKEEGHPHQPMK
jgi:hypothetical protein